MKSLIIIEKVAFLKMICAPKVGRKPTERGAYYLTKYNEDQRLKVIRMLEDGMAVHAIGREMGISRNVIRNWRNRYERGGIDQLLGTRQRYTAAFKLEAVAYRSQNGLSYPQAAADLGIPNQGTLYAWEKIFQLRGPEGLQDTRKGRPPTMPKQEKKPKAPLTREQQLEAENTYLKMENAYLKKLKALVEEREKSVKKIK